MAKSSVFGGTKGLLEHTRSFGLKPLWPFPLVLRRADVGRCRKARIAGFKLERMKAKAQWAN